MSYCALTTREGATLPSGAPSVGGGLSDGRPSDMDTIEAVRLSLTASVIPGWILDYDDYAVTRRSEPKPRSAWAAGQRRDHMAVASARAGCTLAARERSGASDSWAASGRANDPATEGSRPLLSRPPNLQVLATQCVAGTRSLGRLCDRQ